MSKLRSSSTTALIAIFALVLGAQGVAARDAAPSGPTLVENPATLHGVNRVAIGSFTVDILDRTEATADVGGLELVTGAPSDIVVNLVGVDPSRYQTLVDGLYARFVADLQAQGYTVVPREELAANAAFAKAKGAETGAVHLEKTAAGHNHYVSAQGLPIYMVDELMIVPRPAQISFMGKKAVRDPYIGWGTSFGGSFARVDMEKQRDVAKSLGAPVLDVRITLLGGQAHIDRAFWKTRGSGRTDAAMIFVPTYNRVVVVPATGAFSRVSLAEPVATDKLGELVGTTSAANHAMQTAGNAAIAASRVLGAFGGAGGFIGAMHYGNSSAFDLRTDEATFEAQLSKGFAMVSQTLATELAHNR